MFDVCDKKNVGLKNCVSLLRAPLIVSESIYKCGQSCFHCTHGLE